MARPAAAPNLTRPASLLADTSRAAILGTLMDGRELTAGELAGAAGITAPTCSSHLSQLLAAGFLRCRQQGRHRYYALANAEIAGFLESAQVLSSVQSKPVVTGPANRDLRRLRVCYDHLAGELAVDLLQALLNRRWLIATPYGLQLDEQGQAQWRALGIDPTPLPGRRPHCRECLDWSERRPHLAGTLGQRLLDHCLRHDWVRRRRDSRAVLPTPEGMRFIDGLLAV
ncbi:MAG: winged helix-turn-helix transcriptional regulator [Xanthomonadales bacterium]|nr:winged helix-turn-helix transcriptional regulator [Xanthomonadales bacterium]